MIVYQAITRLWGSGKFSSWDYKTLKYLKTLSVDFLYLVGIPRHASGKDFVKGNPGCPYSICDWYETNAYLGSLKDFDNLVNRVHKSGLKLMIDYIPNHISKDYQGEIVHFDYCDGDWIDTLKNDWSSSKTIEEMIKILRYWAAKGVDGFRCDMVELVPSEKLNYVINEVKKEFPSLIFVAEVYNKDNYWIYSYFDLLYDKTGLYDSLISIYNGWASCEAITNNWQSLAELQDKMLCFLENHDEPRITRLIGNRSMAALAVSALFNNSSFMLYFGGEIGESAEESDNCRTSIFNWVKPKGITALWNYVHDKEQLTDIQQGTLDNYRKILNYKTKFNYNNWDLMYCNKDRLDVNHHFAFIRYNENEAYLIVCNFSPNIANLSIRVPSELQYICKQSEIDVVVNSFDYIIIDYL